MISYCWQRVILGYLVGLLFGVGRCVLFWHLCGMRRFLRDCGLMARGSGRDFPTDSTGPPYRGCPSIRAKALSSDSSPGRCASTASSPERLRTRTLENSRLITSRWNLHRSTNHRFGHKTSTMILLCEPPAAVAGAKVENGLFVFQGPQDRLLHRSVWRRERPISSSA